MSDRQLNGASMMAMAARPRPEPSHPGYRSALGPGRPDMYLVESLVGQVSRHVLRHYVPEIAREGAPNVLVIQSEWGLGKTSMTDECLRRLGCDRITMSPGAFEASGKVGGPVAVLEELAASVVAITAREERPLVVHLPDFDQSTASVGSKVETTINSQLFRAHWQLMVDTGGLRTAQGAVVPIIVDGNDFTEMRGSMLRPGRAEFYTLAISAEERAQIVAAMFGLVPSAVRSLCAEHKDKPIAFFRDLKVRLLDQELDTLYRTHGFDAAAIGAGWREEKAKGVDVARLRATARAASERKARSFYGWR